MNDYQTIQNESKSHDLMPMQIKELEPSPSSSPAKKPTRLKIFVQRKSLIRLKQMRPQKQNRERNSGSAVACSVGTKHLKDPVQ